MLGRRLAGSADKDFALIGAFRIVRHLPFGKKEPCTGSAELFSREELLGGPGRFSVKLPPCHIQILPESWRWQRFGIVDLRNILAATHLIPLTEPSGQPLIARFDRHPGMPAWLPEVANKQLYYINQEIFH